MLKKSDITVGTTYRGKNYRHDGKFSNDRLVVHISPDGEEVRYSEGRKVETVTMKSFRAWVHHPLSRLELSINSGGR
jgi:hypothetical protein